MENMKSAGKDNREALLKVDFGLQDKYFDAEELKHSWTTTRMSGELYLSSLHCSISKQHY